MNNSSEARTILNLKRELHLKKKEALVLRGLTEEAQFLVAGVRANSWLRRATSFLQETYDE